MKKCHKLKNLMNSMLHLGPTTKTNKKSKIKQKSCLGVWDVLQDFICVIKKFGFVTNFLKYP